MYKKSLKYSSVYTPGIMVKLSKGVSRKQPHNNFPISFMKTCIYKWLKPLPKIPQKNEAQIHF